MNNKIFEQREPVKPQGLLDPRLWTVSLLTTGTILQYCTRSFIARKKLENVNEENRKKLIHCPRKSLIFQDFQGLTHIFQVFQAWILKF